MAEKRVIPDEVIDSMATDEVISKLRVLMKGCYYNYLNKHKDVPEKLVRKITELTYGLCRKSEATEYAHRRVRPGYM